VKLSLPLALVFELPLLAPTRGRTGMVLLEPGAKLVPKRAL
jgi:hypothetical protein